MIIGNKRRYGLIKIIGRDLWSHGKLPLILIVAILISSILILNTVYYTRWLTTEREQIMLENDALNIEWHHLILEINVLEDHNIVEHIAITKLKMQHVELLQEKFLIQP